MSAPYSICHDHTGVLLVMRGEGMQSRVLVRTDEELRRARSEVMSVLDPDHRSACLARLYTAFNRHLEAAMDRIGDTTPHDTEAP